MPLFNIIKKLKATMAVTHFTKMGMRIFAMLATVANNKLKKK
jgi:hypothetical protein